MFGITERGDAGLDVSWINYLDNPQYIGFIIITKAPQNLIEFDLPKNVIIHCTITGLSEFESFVVPSYVTLKYYYKLLEKYGEDRVVLRVDPIYPYDQYLDSALDIISKTKPKRLRISFLDAYPHVKQRMEKCLKYKNFKISWQGIHSPLNIRQGIVNTIENIVNHKVEICGEPDLECTGCISLLDFKAIGYDVSNLNFSKCQQRKECKCIGIKKELLENKKQCAHRCLYCYWR